MISADCYFSHLLNVIFSYSDQPEITVNPKAEPKREGENVTLTCNATGNPEPKISWTRNGLSMNKSNKSRISFSEDNKQLTITSLKRTDSGEYRCVASNSLGNDTSAATVDVHCKFNVG